MHWQEGTPRCVAITAPGGMGEEERTEAIAQAHGYEIADVEGHGNEHGHEVDTGGNGCRQGRAGGWLLQDEQKADKLVPASQNGAGWAATYWQQVMFVLCLHCIALHDGCFCTIPLSQGTGPRTFSAAGPALTQFPGLS